VQLNILTLTLPGLQRIRRGSLRGLASLPRTVVGAILLGLLVNYGTGYIPSGGLLAQLQPSIPMIFLFVLLSSCLRLGCGSALEQDGSLRPCRGCARRSRPAGSLLIIAAILCGSLSSANLLIGSRAMVLGSRCSP